LECNGSFIDKEDFEAAIDWIEAHGEFESTYDGKSWCDEDGCHAKAEGSASASIECSSATPGISAQRSSLVDLITLLI
jgi:hypothetical protein